jgi:hypothetical protein
MDYPKELRSFFNEDGTLKQWRSKMKKKLMVVEWLGEKFETGRKYTETEVNIELNQWHSFTDPVSLRRMLIEGGVLKRTQDGSEYWKEETDKLAE